MVMEELKAIELSQTTLQKEWNKSKTGLSKDTLNVTMQARAESLRAHRVLWDIIKKETDIVLKNLSLASFEESVIAISNITEMQVGRNNFLEGFQRMLKVTNHYTLRTDEQKLHSSP